MIQVVIVEDLAQERERMEHYLQTYAKEHGEDISVTSFTDGKYLLEQYPEHPDLLLLDIDMEQVSGLEAARRVRTFDRQVQILFVTRMVQYALEGYEVDAADFLVKPVAYPLFETKLTRVLRRIYLQRPRFLELASGRERIGVAAGRITCVEALNKKTIVHLEDGSRIEVTQPLYQIEKELVQEPFFRVHNAFLINLNYVQRFTSQEVMLPSQTVPVSKYRKKAFLNALASFRGSIL